MNYSLPEFLSHAIALEQEAEERYTELADMMEVHSNLGTSNVFRDMARFSKLHGSEILERAKAVELRVLKSWEFRWRLPPEVGDEDGLHYLMTPYHALQYARGNEIRGRDYYRSVAELSEDAEVRRLANEFANEETEHVAALDRLIAMTSMTSVAWAEDLDSPQAL